MKQSLQRYFEGLLGLEPVAAGEDTQWHLRFSIGWPDWVLLLFCLFAVSFVVSIYLREGAGVSKAYKLFLAGIRLAVIAVVVLMLSGLEISIDRTGLPFLVMMIDDSGSMQTRDVRVETKEGTAEPAADGDPARLEAVVRWLEKDGGAALRKLVHQHKLVVYAHSAAPQLVGTFMKEEEIGDLLEKLKKLEANGAESRIGANLRSVLNNLRGTPPSSVILVTDGVVTQGESLTRATQYAARKNVPVFTVGVGDPDELRDLEIHDLLVDDAVFVDDVVSFEAKLSGKGFAGRDVTISLKQEGIPTPLDEKTFRVGEGGKPIPIRLAHRPNAPGIVTYTIETPALDRETSKQNNRIQRQVRVLDEKVRVLYVDAYPRYEFRYLKNLLERESTVDFKVVLLDSDPEYVQQDRAALGFFPTSKEELADFDVLIFGDVPPAAFSQAQLVNIREFVRAKGGGFLLIAGSHSAPQSYRDTLLEDLLPITVAPSGHRNRQASIVQGFTPRLTVDGKSSPLFRFAMNETENEEIWNAFPQAFWFAAAEKAKPGAQVLAEHPTETANGKPVPVIATQFFGAGRTYYQAFDSTWRWRYRSEELYHARYWIQAVRLLSRAKLLGKNRSAELTVDRRKYRRGDPVQLRVRFLDETLAPKGDEAVTVVLDQLGRGQRQLELKRSAGHRSIYETVFGQTEDGQYTVRLTSPLPEALAEDKDAAPTAEFSVDPPPGEMDRVQMDESELRAAAKRTGGNYYPLAGADALFADLPPVPAGKKIPLYTYPPIALWNQWPVILLFVGLLVTEWLLRKRQRLV